MPHKNFKSAFFRIGHSTVEFTPAKTGQAYEYDVAVNHNSIKFSWNTRQAPSITAAVRFTNLAKAESKAQMEDAKYQ